MNSNAESPLMAALEMFEAAEGNLVKLERLWTELEKLIPSGISFCDDPEYEDRARSYGHVLSALPKIDGWKPTEQPPDLNDVAQSRFDVAELDELSAHVSVATWISAPGRELREYRFRLNNKRRALIREALAELIDQVDADLRSLRRIAGEPEENVKLEPDAWSDIKSHVKQIEVLLGSSVQKPARWNDLQRHMHFGYVGDLHDIETLDWPQVKTGLRESLYGANEPLPVSVEDLSTLVAAKPRGPVTTQLAWSSLDEERFERLVFSLISDALSYENPEWLMQTRAPDRGRDLFVTRVMRDSLCGTTRQRMVIQCKHWLKRASALQMPRKPKNRWPFGRIPGSIFSSSPRAAALLATLSPGSNITMRLDFRRALRCGRRVTSKDCSRRVPT